MVWGKARGRIRRSLVAFLAVAAAFALGGCGAIPVASPSLPVATVTPATTPSPSGITRDQAIASAKEARPDYRTADVLAADVGSYADSVGEYTAAHFTPAPAPDRLVWRVRLGTYCGPLCGQGTTVFIDFWDGHVILSQDWIS